MDISILASGSAGNAYVAADCDTSILIECGLPIKKLREKSGFEMYKYIGCLLSHEHGDHSKAAIDVMKSGINLYCSRGTAEAMGLQSHRLKVVEPGKEYKVGTFMVKPFDVKHDCAEPLGYLLMSRNSGEKLLFATDTCYIKHRFSGLTHIMIEANYDYNLMNSGLVELNKRIMRSHMSIETVLAFLKANDLSRLQQIYLLHLSDERSDEEKFLREVRRLTGAEVYIA